jgi:hypothetical protein
LSLFRGELVLCRHALVFGTMRKVLYNGITYSSAFPDEGRLCPSQIRDASGITPRLNRINRRSRLVLGIPP